MNGYPGPQLRNDLYVLLESHTSAIKKHALETQRLEALGVSSLITASLTQQSRGRDEVEFYTFKARYGDGVVIFDPETASILDYISTNNLVTPATESTTLTEPEEHLL
jgi:hypothetical protein